MWSPQGMVGILLAVALAGCMGGDDALDGSSSIDADEHAGPVPEVVDDDWWLDPAGNQPVRSLDELDPFFLEGTLRLRIDAGGAQHVVVVANETFRINGFSVSANGGARFLAIGSEASAAHDPDPCLVPSEGLRSWSSVVHGGSPDIRGLPAGRYVVLLWSEGGDQATVSFNGAGNRARTLGADSLWTTYNLTEVRPEVTADTGTAYAANFDLDLDLETDGLFVGRFTAGTRVHQPGIDGRTTIVTPDGTPCAEGRTDPDRVTVVSTHVMRIDSVLGPAAYTWSGEASGGVSLFDQSSAVGLVVQPGPGVHPFWKVPEAIEDQASTERTDEA